MALLLGALVCFPRDPVFDSQHPHSTSQLSITLISEDMKLPFWPPVGTRHTHVHRHAQQAKYLYESINFLKN